MTKRNEKPEPMFSDEQNRTLTQVGPGTPMGELLRRYWMPIAAVAELDDKPIKPMRLLGEDLVLYRDQAGTYGLDRPALPAPPCRPLLWMGRRLRAALQLPRLGVGSRRAVPGAAIRGDRASRGALQGPRRYQSVSGRGQGRPLVGLPGPQPVPLVPDWELHLAQRLHADRLLGNPL